MRIGVANAVLLASLVAGCGPPRDPVLALLAALEEAAEDRDAGGFGACLSDDFEAQGPLDRAGTVDLLRRYFAAYENVAIETYDVRVSEDGLRVSLVAEFSGRARPIGGLAAFLPPGAVYRFELELARDEPDRTLVRRATWEAQELPGEAPSE